MPPWLVLGAVTAAAIGVGTGAALAPAQPAGPVAVEVSAVVVGPDAHPGRPSPHPPGSPRRPLPAPGGDVEVGVALTNTPGVLHRTCLRVTGERPGDERPAGGPDGAVSALVSETGGTTAAALHWCRSYLHQRPG